MVFDSAGGRHTLIVAATGGGKTTLFNNVAEQATARTDALVWAIDLGKGTVPTVWAPALDASAGIEDHTAAVRILTWAATVIRERSKATGGRNHQPSPQAPVVIVMVDEMDTLIGLSSPVAHKTRPLVEEIFRRGRSAGVLLLAAGQRGVVQHTGSKDVHANAGNKIILRVNRAAEMNNLLPEWEYAGMPNMADYARGTRGIALVVDSENNWRAGRIHDLSDLDAVQHLAHHRGRPAATLEPAIAARLTGYPERHHVGAGPARNIPAPRASDHNPQEGGQPAHRDQGWGVEPGDEDAVARLARGLVTEVEARLADMPTPPEQATSLADMIAAKNAFDHA
ncbi:MAG: type IV secretory system conjugative DNA transfer family protein, partial [Micromonosporaceae bacterium]